MGRHSHEPWRKSILIPFWCIQLLFQVVNIVALVLTIIIVVVWDKNGDDRLTDALKIAGEIIAPVFIGIILICFCLTITEIILLARHKLKPKTFFVMNAFKTLIFTFFAVLEVISYVRYNWRNRGVRLFSAMVLLLAFWIPFLYGAAVYYRFHKDNGFYKQVVDDPAAVPLDTNYPPVPYPQAHQYGYSERDLEIGANKGGKGGSYNHERDQGFEAFRKEREGGEERIPLNKELPAGNEAAKGNADVGVGVGIIPKVQVEMHDGEIFELNSRRELR